MIFEACLASHSRVVSQSQAVYGCPNILDFGILNTCCDLDTARTQMAASSAVKPSRYWRWMTSPRVNFRTGILRIKPGVICNKFTL